MILSLLAETWLKYRSAIIMPSDVNASQMNAVWWATSKKAVKKYIHSILSK